MEVPKKSRKIVTKSQIVEDLRSLGVGSRGDDAVMVHTRMSAIGWVPGGAQAVVEALLDAMGPKGSLLVLTGWRDAPPYHQQAWDESEKQAYMAECPAFDPKKALAEPDYGRVPEAIRTWPGACHSYHPVSAFASLGPRPPGS